MDDTDNTNCCMAYPTRSLVLLLRGD